MKKYIILLIFINFLFGCSSKENYDLTQFTFYSCPAFHGKFKIELDNNKKTVITSIPYEYSLADSISHTTWKFIDSTDLESIKEILPKDIKFEIKPRYSEFEVLKNYFQQLSQIIADTIPPNDGIGIYLERKSSRGKVSKRVFYSPNPSSKQGLLISKIYSTTEKIFEDNSLLEYAIENSQRYINRPVLKIKSVKPLYVKFFDDDPNRLEEEISKLPESETIFVDLTNFHKNKDEYLEKTIRLKYSKIKWILRNDDNYGFAE